MSHIVDEGAKFMPTPDEIREAKERIKAENMKAFRASTGSHRSANETGGKKIGGCLRRKPSKVGAVK